MKKLSLIVVPALILMACGKPPFEVQREIVPFTEMAAGDLYGDGEEGIEAQNTAIYTAEAWATLLEKMNSVNAVDENFTVTDVDFATEMIFVFFDEIRGTDGFQIRATEMIEFEDDVVITVVKTEPTEELLSTVMTQPFYIIKAAKTEKSIVFN